MSEDTSEAAFMRAMYPADHRYSLRYQLELKESEIRELNRRVLELSGNPAKVQLVPVECTGCKRAKLSRGDTTPVHASHWECSGCRQKFRNRSVHDHNPKSAFYFEAKFCPACGAQISKVSESPVAPSGDRVTDAPHVDSPGTAGN